jgi:chromosome segregation protein
LEELGQLLCRLKTQLEALERQELQCNQQLSSLQADKERLTEEKQQLHLTEVELERDEKEYLEACSRLARQLEAASAEREELTEERAQLEIGKRELGARIQELATREEELRSQLTAQEEEQARWQALRRSSEEELSALRVELGSLGERSAQLASQKDELAERCQSAQDRREKTLARDAQLALEAEKLQANLAQLEQELQSQGQARLELEQELSRLRASRGLMREQVRTVSQQAQEEKLALEQAQGRLHEYEIQLARLDAEGEKLAEELWEKHQLKVEQLSEAAVPQLAISRQEAQRNIKQLMGKRQELGNVNFGAIEELKQLQGRVRFLESQLQDLKQARAALLDLIEEIDHTSRRKLAATFSEVNAAFGMVFGKLFRGGAGHLELSAPEGERVDPLTAGVEVMVQLPGKKQQHIQLLSGGERAFVAIAFLFSILKVHPAPFCVLDEIDAPLDEANLQRFSALLREFVAQTQFIVVTHRRRTMEEADALYGVTMQEAGISQLVSVRLQDAI